MGPLITGVAVVLVFSIAWPLPIRGVNGFLCFGVVLGGFVAGTKAAKANDNRLESVRGLKLGAKVGFVAALIVILVDLLVEYTALGGDQAGVDYLDPIPRYIYATIYGIWDGLLDMVARDEGRDGLEWPGRIARYTILIASTVLFGAFGGAVAASTYAIQPSLDEEPENRPNTPLRPTYVRSPAVFQMQAPQEATIFQPEAPARPAAATGTFGSPPGGGVPPPARPASPYAVDPPAAPAFAQETIFTPQPYFDEAAQGASTRRPNSPVSVEPPSRSRSEEHA
ncbi:MAG: hypothetical protein JJ896_09880 [Rhodothermales bacterium]|nr:hypothetical protein [Rhodothermales bacterium]MBO6779949.1 hypothetical protein [Rhodothermales bacterium]